MVSEFGANPGKIMEPHKTPATPPSVFHFYFRGFGVLDLGFGDCSTGVGVWGCQIWVWDLEIGDGELQIVH